MAEGSFELDALLGDLDDHVTGELESMPDVEDVGDDLDLDDLAVDERRWTRVDEIVAVVADLKDSTRLGTGKHAASTASIYDAAVRPLVKVLADFDAGDIAIEGDGAVGIFWGDRRIERAMCAGITVKTFSQKALEPKLEKKWPNSPLTGFKIGVAASRILVKRIGLPRTDYQEEVWAGKAVNYAAKAAQCADRREMWVTGTVWERVSSNDYIIYTCGCPNGQPADTLWEDIEITRLPEGDEDRYGRKLTSTWCDVHGQEFCNAILQGKTSRPTVGTAPRLALADKMTTSVIQEKRSQAKQLRIARLGRR
jgi:class 3 adenylate cyclase